MSGAFIKTFVFTIILFRTALAQSDTSTRAWGDYGATRETKLTQTLFSHATTATLIVFVFRFTLILQQKSASLSQILSPIFLNFKKRKITTDMKRYCLALDLVNDPELIKEYEHLHKAENGRPEIKKVFLMVG